MAKRTLPMVLLWIILTAALMTAVVRFAAPPVLQKYLQKNDVALTGRKISFDRIHLSLLTGKLSVTGLTVFEADGVTPFVKAAELTADLSLAQLLTGKICIQKAFLDGFDGTLVQNGKKRNIDDLVQRFSSGKDTPSRQNGFRMKNVRIRKSAVRYRDIAYGRNVDLENLNIDVPDIDLSRDGITDAGLEFDVSDKGHAKVELGYAFGDDRIDTRVTIENLDLSVIYPFIVEKYALSGMDGHIDTKLHLVGNSSHLADLFISGTAALRDFRSEDTEGEKALSFDSLLVDIRSADLSAGRYALGDVSVSGLEACYRIDSEGCSNLDRILGRDPSRDTSLRDAGAKERKRREITAQNVTVSDGRLEYCDESLRRTFRYTVDSIDVKSERRADGVTATRISARMNDAHLDGEMLRPSSPAAARTLTVRLSNLDVRDFSPYCEAYTAYPLKDGVLTFTSDNVITGRSLSSVNEIDAHGLEVGRRNRNVQTSTHIPLRAAVYALNDRSGHMHLSIPVSGDLDNPKFHFGRVLAKSLGKLLIKVAASPFASFTSRHAEDDLMYVEFDTSSSDFTTSQMHKLLKIKDKIAEFPQMKAVAVQYFHMADTAGAYRALSLQKAGDRNVIVAERLGIDPSRVRLASADTLQAYSGTPRFIISMEPEEGNDENF